ncbi:DUF3592 domain-containing protein [Streptomyces exfoliatus]|uniref:DUF3592 domain-containing protein n=1 Tax=Streptomyces vilmorinianum TaxID=3051092 RepID=UPI0015869BAA
MTAMETAFLLAGLAGAIVCVLCLRRVLIVIRLVMRGERADGWCAKREMFRATSNNSSHPQFTFAFRTPDGELVEFKDRPGAFGYGEGEPVRVCYDPARPRKRATIAGPDTWGPVYVRLFVGLPLGLVSYLALISLARHRGLA